MTQEALKLALEKIATVNAMDYEYQAWAREALRENAMREVQRLGQEIEQEPVAWMKPDVLCDRACMYLCTKGFTQFPECATTHPPQRTWVGLTEQEQGAIMEDINAYGAKLYSFAKAIEAKLKQKNGFAEEKNNG